MVHLHPRKTDANSVSGHLHLTQRKNFRCQFYPGIHRPGSELTLQCFHPNRLLKKWKPIHFLFLTIKGWIIHRIAWVPDFKNECLCSHTIPDACFKCVAVNHIVYQNFNVILKIRIGKYC